MTTDKGITPSQTVGPFFKYGLTPNGQYDWNDAFTGNLVTPDTSGERIRIEGRVFDGVGRCGTDADGAYAFDTIMPGSVPDPDGKPQAPHVLLAVFGRGMLRHLYTRIYFGSEAANESDPVLALVPPDRRATLIATRDPGNAVYRQELYMQGDNETVFFDM